MLPQRHTDVVGAGTRTCPMSPAAPWAPRWSRPPDTMPEPMPVRDLDEEEVRRRRAGAGGCSPSAMMLTSLSTRTGSVEALLQTGRARRSRPSRA